VLSVAVITYNEERNIERCLASVVALADDIVVVDSGSTDRTVELATAAGARVLMHRFEGHIQQKNHAIEHCRHDWVLSLDADEALSAELAASIRAVLTAPRHDGYAMNRLTQYCGSWIRHGGWYPDRKVRLFRRGRGAWAGVNPHDRYELTDRHATVGRLSGDLLHYSYASISDHLRQIDYFTGITASELHRSGKTAPLWRIVLAPPFRLFRDYILKGGWMDGFHGFVIAILSSTAVLIKYAKLRHLRREGQRHG
jgi:glycosyltransferase involved in cell wall biosynthesis